VNHADKVTMRCMSTLVTMVAEMVSMTDGVEDPRLLAWMAEAEEQCNDMFQHLIDIEMEDARP
jgi:hypothetical protein